MKINWYFVVGIAVYTAMGQIFMNVVADYIDRLAEEVRRIDVRYAKRLYLRFTVMRTRAREVMVNVAFMIFWPVICIAAILKAEWEYDLIMHHTPFGKGCSR